MEMTNWIYLVGSSLLQHIPQFLVIIAGLIFCFLNLKKFPKAGKIALAGLIILFLVSIFISLLPAVYTYLTIYVQRNARDVRYFIPIIGFLVSLLNAFGLGLLIFAVWAGRKSPE